MATISGAGGTTTSLSNTPQAGDDYYSFTEDQLLGDSTLYSVANDTIYLNVMANDLGGKAKSLFSISDVDGTPIDDLTTTDLLSNSKNSCWERTTEGNWIRISNGKIEYRLDGRNVDSLGVGDIIADSFVYAIKLGNGTLSWATVHVNLAGSNDAMVIAPGGDYSGGVAETSGMPIASAPDLTDSGSFTYTDVDTSDIATVGAALKSVNGSTAGAALALALGSFSASISGDTAATNGGTVNWSYAVDPDLLESMAQGETLVMVYTVTVDDGHGSTQPRDVTITVTGTNDAPAITSELQEDTVKEDETLSVTGQVTASDVDHGAVLTYACTDSSAYGSFAVDLNTGAWTYTLDNDAHQSLAQGESHDEEFDVVVADQWGLTSYQTVTIHIVGTNDDPELTEVQANLAAGSEDAAYVVTLAELLQGFSDIDTGDVLAVANLSADHGSVTDNLNGTFTIVPAANYHGPVVLSYNVVDDHGGSLPATLSFELAAVQDLTAQDDSFSGDEDQPISGSVAGNDSTTSGGLLSYAVATGPANGSLTFNPDGSFEYNPDGNYNGADSFTVTVYDASANETLTQTVSVTVASVNDAAVITGATSGIATEAGGADNTLGGSNANGDLNATDVDGIADAWTAIAEPTAGVNGYGSYTIDATGNWTYVVDQAHVAVQALGVGGSLDDSFTVTTADGTAQVVSVTIDGANDAPKILGDMAATVAEGGSFVVTPALVGHSDPDDIAADAIYTVSAVTDGDVRVNGVVQSTFTGAQLAAGLVTYNHNGGEATAVYSTFDLTVEDGNEDGSVPTPTTFFITVTPVNDAPVLTGDRLATVLEGGTYVLTGTDLGFSDPDDIVAGVTFAVSGLTNGVIKVSGTTQTSFTGTQLAAGQVSFVHDGSETLAASFQVSVEDGNEDGSTPLASAFNLTVTPVADIDAANDSWVLSDTTLPVGTITANWFTHNDTGAPKYVVSVAGLTADGEIGSTGLSADFEVVGGVNQLVAITGSAAIGTHSFNYTLSDGSSTDTATVSLIVLNTNPGNNNGFAPLNGNDFSYIDLQAGSDTIVGDAVLVGNAGIDIFVGGDGNDNLTGGDGNDTLSGGLGNDTFRFLLTSDAVDTILDFNRSTENDTIVFDNDSFTALGGTGTLAAAAFRIGTAAADADDRIIYDGTTGKLYYDADGNGAALQIHIATLDDGLALTNGAFNVI